MIYHLALLLLGVGFATNLFAKPLCPPDTCTTPAMYLCTQPVVSNIICPQFCLDTAYAITAAHATFDCSLTLMGNCLRYIALPGYFGTDVVQVIACNAATCDTATLYIEVVNSPDLCTGEAPPCKALPIDLCTDWNTPTLICPDFCFTQAYTLVSAGSIHPSNISIGGQCLSYTPLLESVSWDAISIIACPDASGGNCDTVLVNITLGNCNLPPPITPNQTCTPVFTPTDLCFSMEAGEIYSADSVSTSFQCSITAFAQSCITYYPLPGFSGADTVNIPICRIDNPNDCRLQQFIVYVGCELPASVNDIAYISPELLSINGTIIPDVNGYNGIVVNILQNDVNNCLAPISPAIFAPPAHGTAQILPDNSISYQPDAGFNGADAVTLQLCNACNQCTYSSLHLYIAPQPDTTTTTGISIFPTTASTLPAITGISYLAAQNAFAVAIAPLSGQNARLSLYATNGQCLIRQSVEPTTHTLLLPATALPSGIYIVSLETEQGRASVKVWKE